MKSILLFAGKRVGRELLEFLLAGSYPVTSVVVSNKNHELVSQFAESKGVKWLKWSDFLKNHSSFERVSWIVNAWSPYVLPSHVIGLADSRLNIHPSLVPHAKGADSSAWILRQNLPCGVSLLEMTSVLDEGGVYIQKPVPIDWPERGQDIHSRLQDAAIILFKESWSSIYEGRIKPVPQSNGGSSFTRSQTNEDRVRSPEDFVNTTEMSRWMLAHDFYPKSSAELYFNGKRFTVILKPKFK